MQKRMMRSVVIAAICVVCVAALLLAGCKSTSPTAPRTFTYVTAAVANNTIALSRPSTWADQSTSGKTQYGEARGADGSGGSGCTLFASAVPNFIEGGMYMSKESYISSLQSAWKQQASGKIEMTGPTTLAGREATQSIATVTIKGVPSRTWQVIAEGPQGDLARVAYTCPLTTYDANLPAMRKALESFTFG